MKSWTLRDWVNIAIIGALWGAIEIGLGSYLHILIPPLANTFFSGLILAFLGIVIVLAGQRIVPQRGAILMIGIITALLKLLSYGGVKVGPMVAILAQATLMELGLWWNRTSRGSHMLAGALAVGWNAVHPLLMLPLLFGRTLPQAFAKIAGDGAAILGLDPSCAWLILLLLLVIRWTVGAVAGWLAWQLGQALERRSGTV